MSDLLPYLGLLVVGIGATGLAARRSRSWPRLRRAVRAGIAVWRAAPWTAVQTGDEYNASPVVQVRFLGSDEDPAA